MNNNFMEKPYLKIKKLREGAIIPTKREEDAAFDIYCVLEEDYKIIFPGDIFLAPTAISLEFPKNWVFYVGERGSSGSKGLSRRCGIIDSGYRGELFIALNNTSNKPIILYKDEEKFNSILEKNSLQKDKVTPYPLSKGVAQAMLLYAPHVDVEEVNELDMNSQRGTGALGSSGK